MKVRSDARHIAGPVLLGLLLASCAGSSSRTEVPPATRAPWATVEVAVDVHGNARVSVLAAGLHLATLRSITADAAATVFPGVPPGDVHLLTADSASISGPAPVQGVTEVPGAVPPGSSPSFSIDGPTLDARLRVVGVRTLRLSVCVPSVPVTETVDPPTPVVATRGCRVWLPERSAVLPSTTISLHPQAWRFAAGVLGALAAAALAFVGFLRRSRLAAWLAWAMLLAALILGLGGLDDAQVGGLLGGGKILEVGWTAALVAGVLAGAGATATLLRRRAQDVVPAPERPTVPVH